MRVFVTRYKYFPANALAYRLFIDNKEVTENHQISFSYNKYTGEHCLSNILHYPDWKVLEKDISGSENVPSIDGIFQDYVQTEEAPTSRVREVSDYFIDPFNQTTTYL